MAHEHLNLPEISLRNRSGGIGAILGLTVIVALVAGLWYLAFGPGRGTFGGGTSLPDVDIDGDLPSVDPAAT